MSRVFVSNKCQVLVRQEGTSDDGIHKLIGRSIVMIEDVMQNQARSHVDDVLAPDEIVTMTDEPEITSAPVNNWPNLPTWTALLFGCADLAFVPALRAIVENPVAFTCQHQPVNTLLTRVPRAGHLITKPTNRTENRASGQDTAPHHLPHDE